LERARVGLGFLLTAAGAAFGFGCFDFRGNFAALRADRPRAVVFTRFFIQSVRAAL
jgi:hypothetical protein